MDMELEILDTLGATPRNVGVDFRVWAPHAAAVSVVGDFNDWSRAADPMQSGGGGHWFCHVSNAEPGQEYRYALKGEGDWFTRIDPYAKAVTNSVGNGVIADMKPCLNDGFAPPDWNRLVIYEMHIGTFSATDGDPRGTFNGAARRLEHLKALGINAVQIMPTAEFAGDISWGYNPAHIFAVETAYGGPNGLRDFVRAAHEAGIAVILDVVFNHFGPSDLDLWRFDGWYEGDGGGIYFYNDWRAETPWGATRPNYGRSEVRRFIRDAALFWLESYGIDGLRWDMTLYIRNVSGNETHGAHDLPDGWSLMQWVNDEIAERLPGRITIAEDLRRKDEITAPTAEGGAGFGAQWDADFVHPVREVLTGADDEARDMSAVVGAIEKSYNGDPFRRVVYTESHDEVSNGKSRIPHEVDSANQGGWFAQKRSTLGAALIFTVPGIPMIFQGQEFLQGNWFDDTVPLDWAQRDEFQGIVKLFSDLIDLRLGIPALYERGVDLLLADDQRKVVAFRRFVGDDSRDVLVALNFRAVPAVDVTISLPIGRWQLSLNSDWSGYSSDFGNYPSSDIRFSDETEPTRATFSIGPYSALVFIRNE